MITNPGRRRRRPLLATPAPATAAGITLLPTTAQVRADAKADNPSSRGFAAVTLRSPNESDPAGTVTVSMRPPADLPVVSLSTEPVPGWTVTAPKEKLSKPYDDDGTTITRSVTWTADKGTQIASGESQELSITAGVLGGLGLIAGPAGLGVALRSRS